MLLVSFWLGAVSNLNILPARTGIPIAKIRLIGAVVTALGFGVMLYLAAPSPIGFTTARGLFLVWGVMVGSVIGFYEAKLVLSEINQRTFMWLWRISVVTAVLVLAPLVLALLFLGESEGAGFMVYAVLPAIPAFLGSSGYRYNKFEQEKSVQIYSGPFGFEFWTEPVVGNSEKFYLFIRDLQVKDTSTMWQQIGYAKIYQRELKKCQTLPVETKESLMGILEMFNRYRIVGLTILGLIVIVGPLILAFSFTRGFGLLDLPLSAIMNVTMPIVGGLFVTFFVVTFSLTRLFNRRVAKMLSQLDTDQLYKSQ
jgi:hypothetical protein